MALFLAGFASTFHEAILWGGAFALAAFDFTCRYALGSRGTTLVLAGAASTLALLTRASVGSGPVVARALLAGIRFLARDRRRAAVILAVAAVPVILYVSVNQAKFGTLLGVPFERQEYAYALDPFRAAALAANDGDVSAPRFVPTTLFQYLRPDALELRRHFPFVTYPRERPVEIGGVALEYVHPTSSLPASMPLLVVLGALGAVVVRGATRIRAGTVALRVSVFGAAAGFLATCSFAWVAHRHLGDALPLLVLLSLIGLAAFVRWHATSSPRALRVVATSTLVVLGGFGIAVNLSLGLWYQRVVDPNVRPDLVRGFVGLQADIEDALFGEPLPATEVDELPRSGALGDLAVIGDCDGLYVNNGLTTRPWHAVERTAATGGFSLEVVFPADPEPGRREPLLSARGPGEAAGLGVEYRGDDEVAFGYFADATGAWRPAEAVTVEAGRTYVLDAVLDRRAVLAEVWSGDEPWLRELYFEPPPDDPPITVGRSHSRSVARRFTGEIRALPEQTPVCEESVSR